MKGRLTMGGAMLLITILLPITSAGQQLHVPNGFSASGIGTSNNANNVGIGNNDPWEKLHVVGRMGLGKFVNTGHAGLQIEYTDGGSGSTVFKHQRWGGDFWFRREGSSGERTQLFFGGSSNHYMDIYNGSNEVKVRLYTGGDSFLNGGNVGVGTTTPTYLFDVNGNAHVTSYLDVGPGRNSLSALTGLNVYDPDGGPYTNMQFAQRGWGGSHAILFNAYKSATLVNGGLSTTGNTKHSNSVGSFYAGAGMIHYGANGGSMDFYISPNSSGQNSNVEWGVAVLSLRRGGNVGIGTENPDAKLAVKGTVHAEEVKVDLNVPGPDYVFEKNYDLPSLESVRGYIEEHKHLPEIPSAKDMETNGIMVGEMNMLLLKKVEELTLYVIELNKHIEKKDSEMVKLDAQVASLKADLSKLTSNESKP